MSSWNVSASVAEIDVDVGEQRDFPLFIEFIEGEGFFVGKKRRGWQDGWVRLQVEWLEWTLLSSEETPVTDHPVDDQLTGASANYSRCPSILSLSAEGGLLSCEKLYWVSPKKLGTWDSLSKRPTAGVSCREFIINSVNGASRGYSYLVTVRYKHELTPLFVIIHSHSFSSLFTQDRMPSFKSKMCVGSSLKISSGDVFIYSPLISISISHWW